MKKLLLLGGSEAQLVSICKAKELGYYTIVCDYLPNNPGQYIADKFYLASTTEKDDILKIAMAEKINGIIAYGSDPAAPTAAYVANAMGLYGLNYDVVRCFCEKHLFRKFLERNGFNVPRSIEVTLPFDVSTIDLSRVNLPVIVKPTDSSGSKGITVLYDNSGLNQALCYAKKYSRNKSLIIEEFIERDHPHVIEAEIFAVNGEVKSWGLMNSIRDSQTNPLLPSAYTYPIDLSDNRKILVKNEVTRLIKTAGSPSGAFNIEMIIDSKNRLFFLDVGPRNGGNMLPELMSLVSGKDIVKATIQNAMGNTEDLDIDHDGESGGYWGLGVLHSLEEGIFESVDYSDCAKKAIVREVIQKKIGDKVHRFSRCNDLVGLTFYHFDTKQHRDEIMINMNSTMKVNLR